MADDQTIFLDADDEDAKLNVKDLTKRVLDGVKKTSEIAKAALEKHEQIAKEVKTFGGKFGDTDAKLTELSKHWADQAQRNQDTMAAIDALSKRLDKPAIGSKDEKDETRLKSVDFYRQKHRVETANPEDAKNFNEKSITDDMLAAYALAREAQRKMFRIPANVKVMETELSRDELHALKALSTAQGNRFWLQQEIADRIIACFEEQDDLQSIFSSMTISRSSIVFPMDLDVDEIGGWACELDCAQPTTALQIPGTATIDTHELRAQVVATHKFLEDSEIPVEDWISRKVGMGLRNLRNKAFMTADGDQKVRGLLRNTDIPFMNSGAGLSAPVSGKFTWQDLVLLYVMLPDRFSANASYLFSKTALASMLTMADADGKPIWTPQLLQAGGIPPIMGRPIRVVTQMPAFSDANGAAIVGNKPVACGDWRELYMVVNRLGLWVERDPYTYAQCGVRWVFRSRLGGDVLCPNAANFLKIV